MIRVVGFHNKSPMITFAYRKSQMVNVAAEKTTEEHLNEAVKRFGQEVHCDFNDYALYIDDASDVSRYVLLLEPDTPIAPDCDGTYGQMMQRILSEVNPEYGFIARRGSLGRAAGADPAAADPRTVARNKTGQRFFRQPGQTGPGTGCADETEILLRPSGRGAGSAQMGFLYEKVKEFKGSETARNRQTRKILLQYR